SVDTRYFAWIVVQINADCAAQRKDDLGDVRKVILALVVCRLNASQRLKQVARFKAIDSTVDLADLSLLCGRIPLFDDARERAIFRSDDASVAGWIWHLDAQNRTRRARLAMMLDQLLQRLGANQRHVAVQKQNERIRVFQQSASRLDSVARAFLFFLNDEA